MPRIKLRALTIKVINLINRSAEIAIYIDDNKYRGKGFSKEATVQTLRLGFYKLGLHRIYLIVIDDNEIANKLYASIVFIKEGANRESVFKNNCLKNEIVSGILRSEYHG